MVDYAEINRALDRTREEVRAHVLAEGTAVERARIVTEIRRKAANLYGAADNTNARHYAVAADFIERGDRARTETKT